MVRPEEVYFPSLTFQRVVEKSKVITSKLDIDAFASTKQIFND